MSGRKITLTVISGPEAGKSFDLTGVTMVGRDADCDVVLTDSSVSSRHARIKIDPTCVVSDLSSANHTFVNNDVVIDAPLRSGDVIVFGSTAARIDIRDLVEEEKVRKAKKKKVLLFSVIGLLVIGLVGMVWTMQQQEKKRLTEVELTATALGNSVNFPGVKRVRFPMSTEFVPQTPNVRITRALSPWWTLPALPTNRGELEISRVLPPDPPAVEYRRTRSWTDRPPRLGARRIVQGASVRQSFVLGVYRSVEFTYQNTDLADTEPLSFSLLVQSWDGLPTTSSVAWVGMDRRAYEKGEETSRVAVPRRYPFRVPDTLWETRTETEQSALISYSSTRNLYLKFEKVGEALYIISVDYPMHQRSRLESLIEMLVEGQELPGRTRPQTHAQLREMAVLLEREADAFVPEITSWTFDDFERFDRKSDMLRAFARYMKALEYRQVVDDWLNNSDYERLFAKTLMIYNYVEDDRSLFRRLFWEIEDGIAAHRSRRADLREVRRVLDTLHTITYEGTDLQVTLTLDDESEHTVSLAPDEWLMYTHLRKIVVRQLEGR